MKYIDMSRLMIGDIILTTSQSILGSTIRAKTWPGRSWFDMNLATHVAIVCDRGGGLYYACEMIGGGLEMSEMQVYDNKSGSWFKHVIAVRRHPELVGPGGAFEKRRIMNEYMIKTHSFKVHYGYDKLLEYIFPKAPDNPYTMICSQWAAKCYNEIGIDVPFADPKSEMCSPAQWQGWKSLNDVDFAPKKKG